MREQDLMKLNYLATANRIKNVKAFQRRIGRKLSKAVAKRHNNTQMFVSSLSEWDLERALLRKEARGQHLARALMKGQPYSEVENSVKDGNEPPLTYISMYLPRYHTKHQIKSWLNGETHD